MMRVELKQNPMQKATLGDLSVSYGTSFYADVYASNNTGSAVTKDVLVAYGIYNPDTNEFTMYWGYLGLNVSIPVGENQLIVTMDCVAEQVGTWDVFAAIGTYNESTGEFVIEDAIVKEDELTVTGVMVTDVVLHT